MTAHVQAAHWLTVLLATPPIAVVLAASLHSLMRRNTKERQS
jgi:hypothetical protein